MAKPPTLDFLRTESGAGVVLALAAVAGLVAANSPVADSYFALVGAQIPVRLGGFSETLTLEAWVRDGLMAVFFFVVGLEVKFEVLRGEFSSPRRLAAPLLAAVGGMAGPALVYLALNSGAGGAPRGWPIPTPTDLAFALAALAIFAGRLPQSLRLFLLTLAVADDIGAVALIAVVFSTHLDLTSAAAAALILLALAGASSAIRIPRFLYALAFVGVWALTLRSGVSTSVAAFACALVVPVEPRRSETESTLKTFLDALHPYVAYLILPLFAFVSAGVPLAALSIRSLLAPPALGVALGLMVGKPLGVFLMVFAAAALRLGRRPLGATWLEMLGVSLLCGAGFTLSFFLSSLAFGPTQQAALRAAVILASTVSVLAGGALLTRLQALRAARGLGEDLD